MDMTGPNNSLEDTLREIDRTINKTPEAASERLEALAREHPSHPGVLTLFSHAKALEGEYAAAASSASRAVELDGENVKARYILGYCHQRLGEHLHAARVYRGIIAKTPESAVAHLCLGDSLTGSGDTEGAIKAFRTAVALDTDGDVGRLAEEEVLRLKGAC